MPTPWIDAYLPKTAKDVVGQNKAVERVIQFVDNFKSERKKGLLLYGPTGSGKTATAIAVAKERNLEILEINASDVRNKGAINTLLGSAVSQMSLFGTGKLILIDEIDGLSGTKDRGGIQEVARIIKTSAFPIILTASDPYDKKFSTLRKEVELVGYQTLNYLSITNILKNICEKESVVYEEEALKQLARMSGGDARMAINDLQTLSGTKITKSSLENLGFKDPRESIPQALLKVLKTTDANIARTAFDNVSEDIDTVLLWMDYNMPKEYTKPRDLKQAYEHLSRADVFRGRIMRWQHWRFLVYIYALTSAGVATSKEEKYKVFIQYQQSSRLLKLWQAKMKYGKRKAIAEKFARAAHTSTKQAIKNVPYLKAMMQNPALRKQLEAQLELDKEEVSWLTKEKLVLK